MRLVMEEAEAFCGDLGRVTQELKPDSHWDKFRHD